ncbi:MULTISPECIES: DUF6090 family protein [unclassified Polaribacter]|uniref:DUF6090 family protein n=1 Tax=unclassified Polaribacter TaxID=196858 RepID=UPI0011BE18B9|nr:MULTISPECIES: DUF6090 family protein [unclassified Polaribacter]TXD54378.1 hypothetical protein ES043_00565 [Polaribacter sp. IC063]TXD62791.1 hypothetical protein ES044_00195 [Polaribacter sp. IC066]
MIKIFRNIRRNLLFENKTSKYFKYAIGEIVLVVAGILVVLQISNWNETLKNGSLKQVYSANLINDLTKDAKQLNVQLIDNKETLKILDSVIAFIRKPTTTKINSKDFVKAHTIGGVRTLKTDNTNTFKLLVSTGTIDLFKDTVAQKYMELNRLQAYETFVSSGNSKAYFDLYGEYDKQYASITLISDNENLVNQLWQEVDA